MTGLLKGLTGENMENELVGFVLGILVTLVFIMLLVCNGFLSSDKKMAVVFPDGTFIKGIRKAKYIGNETRGTHHIFVTQASDKELIGLRVAIPINSAKYFVIEGK